MKYTDVITAGAKCFFPIDENIFDYYIRNTNQYGEYNVFCHYGVNHKKSEFVADIKSLTAYIHEELGLKKGDCYTVFMPTNVESVMFLYALNRLGVITALVHPQTPPAALKKMLAFTKSKGIAILDMFLTPFAPVISECGISCVACVPATYAYPDKCSAPAKPEAIEAGKSIAQFITFPEILKKYAGKDAPSEALSSCKDDVAIYMHGGGTTGESKTIKLTNYNLNWVTWMTTDDNTPKTEPGVDTTICCMPLFHAFGLVAAAFAALHEGAKAVFMPVFDADNFIKVLKTEKVREFNGVPNMYRKLIAHPEFDGPHLANVESIYCGGDALDKAAQERLREILRKNGSYAEVCQGYGLTECCAVDIVNRPWDNKPGSIGVPQRGLTVEIRDEDMKRVNNGEIGEIVISGPVVMQGYLTEDGPVDDGVYYDEKGKAWIRSGDLGYMDDEGFVFFVGRKKRVVIISGYNVYPRDIEVLLSEMPEIKEACAVQGYAGTSPIVRLFLVLNDENTDKSALEEKIAKACESKISKFAVPREYKYIDALPRTKLDKIDFMSLSQFKPEA